MEMENVIYYDKFISEKNILHSDTVTNYSDGLIFLLKNKENTDIITYNQRNNFLLLSIGVLQADENNNYYYEHTLTKDVDMIDNIRVEPINKNIKISYYIGGILYDPNIVKEILFFTLDYHDFKIRITFLEKPSNDFDFSIYSRAYLLDHGNNKNKITTKKIITNTNIYMSGMCMPLNENEPKIIKDGKKQYYLINDK